MENNFRNWSGSSGTLDLPSLPNPFATESGNNSFNDAPPKVFFPPKMSLTKELGYKKKRPILEHISTSTNSPNKLPLKPTTSHPLNHQISTSPITPPFFEKFHKNYGIIKRHSSPTTDKQNSSKNKEKIKLALGKRRSMPDISINTTNLKNDLLKEEGDDEKKVVIVHEVKPSDTIAGVALLYGIEISILKKANKLWANDSIHLRKSLYIPIDQCSIIDDEAKVIVQDDHISIKINRSPFSDNIIRPSFSPTPTTPSTPFTIYERELLFCTLPEHANYVNGDHVHNHNHNHTLHSSHASTSSLWSSASSSASISSTTSNNSSTNNFTRAEIQQLPADKLTFFPSKRLTLTKPSSTPNTPLTPTLPSPSPVSHLNRHQQLRSISFPLPTMTQDSTNLDNVDEKYWKKSFASVKIGMDKRTNGIFIDSYGAGSLNKGCNKKVPRLVSSTFVRNSKHA